MLVIAVACMLLITYAVFDTAARADAMEERLAWPVVKTTEDAAILWRRGKDLTPELRVELMSAKEAALEYPETFAQFLVQNEGTGKLYIQDPLEPVDPLGAL